MNSKIIVTGTIGSITTRQYVDRTSNMTKELLTISVPYRTDLVKDANGQDSRVTKWCSASMVKNEYNAKFAKGDNVTIFGVPDVDTYSKQDGTLGVNFRILKPEITLNVQGSRIMPYEQVKNQVQYPNNPTVPGTPGAYNPNSAQKPSVTPNANSNQVYPGNPYQGGYNPNNPTVPGTPGAYNPNSALKNTAPYNPVYGQQNPNGNYQQTEIPFDPNISDDDLPF